MTERPEYGLLDVALALPFEAPARLHPIEVSINVNLQRCRRMAGRPSRRLWLDAAKAQPGQIKLIDKNIDRPDRIVPRSLLGAIGADRILDSAGVRIRRLGKNICRRCRSSPTAERAKNGPSFGRKAGASCGIRRLVSVIRHQELRHHSRLLAGAFYSHIFQSVAQKRCIARATPEILHQF
jgi:hypothetical protein